MRKYFSTTKYLLGIWRASAESRKAMVYCLYQHTIHQTPNRALRAPNCALRAPTGALRAPTRALRAPTCALLAPPFTLWVFAPNDTFFRGGGLKIP